MASPFTKLARKIKKKAKRAPQRIKEELTAELMGKVIKMFLKLAKKAVKDKPSKLKLPGGIHVIIENVHSRVDMLHRFAKNPPKNRKEILQLIKLLSPNYAIISESAHVPGLEMAGIGVEIPIDVHALEEMLDKALQRVGV